jgi:hypothetical protein
MEHPGQRKKGKTERKTTQATERRYHDPTAAESGSFDIGVGGEISEGLSSTLVLDVVTLTFFVSVGPGFTSTRLASIFFTFMPLAFAFAIYRLIFAANEVGARRGTSGNSLMVALVDAIEEVEVETVSAELVDGAFKFGLSFVRSMLSAKVSSWRTKPMLGRTILRRTRTKEMASGAWRPRVAMR